MRPTFFLALLGLATITSAGCTIFGDVCTTVGDIESTYGTDLGLDDDTIVCQVAWGDCTCISLSEECDGTMFVGDNAYECIEAWSEGSADDTATSDDTSDTAVDTGGDTSGDTADTATDTGSIPIDADGDGYDDTSDCDDTDASLNLNDADGDGYSTCTSDCDDAESTAYPGAEEVCEDSIDQDCDGADEECSTVRNMCWEGDGTIYSTLEFWVITYDADWNVMDNAYGSGSAAATATDANSICADVNLEEDWNMKVQIEGDEDGDGFGDTWFGTNTLCVADTYGDFDINSIAWGLTPLFYSQGHDPDAAITDACDEGVDTWLLGGYTL